MTWFDLFSVRSDQASLPVRPVRKVETAFDGARSGRKSLLISARRAKRALPVTALAAMKADPARCSGSLGLLNSPGGITTRIFWRG
jgi:hypothetical protein